MLTLYGLGNILGAGIYVLIGEVAAESGDGLIWSFLIAALVASFTAITYSTLAGKYAKSAGAAVYTSKAFNKPVLSTVIGLSIAATAKYNEIAIKYGLTLAQMSLAWVNQQQFVTATIIGATNLTQLKENIGSMDITLSKECVKEINAVQELFPNPAP